MWGLSVLAALIGVGPACSTVMHRGEELPFEARADELAVLTYNVFGFPLLEPLQRPARFGEIRDELTSTMADVDVVVLQEAFIASTQVLRTSRAHALSGACGDHPTFNPTGLVVLTDHELTGEAASFAFVKDNSGAWTLRSEQHLDCEELATRRKAMKGMMSLTVATDQGPVDVINVHLDINAEARKAQKRLISDFLKQRRSARPLVLAGDLNEEACGAAPSTAFPGDVKLSGASCGVGPTVGGLRRGMIQGAVFPAEIDSVYVCGATPTGKQSRMFSRPRRGGHLSDHDGVLTLVRIPGDVSERRCRLQDKARDHSGLSAP